MAGCVVGGLFRRVTTRGTTGALVASTYLTSDIFEKKRETIWLRTLGRGDQTTVKEFVNKGTRVRSGCAGNAVPENKRAVT